MRKVTGRNRQRLDLDIDPPPDLGFEIDITHSSHDRQAIYASLGVRELWRYDGKCLQFFRLDRQADHSLAFPAVVPSDLEAFLDRSAASDDAELDAAVEAWARKLARKR